MPPIEKVTDSQLGSRFWITKDTESFQKIYENSGRRLPSFSYPKLTRVKSSDRRMLSLTQTGVTDKLSTEKLTNALDHAKAFAKKVDVDGADFQYNKDLARDLGCEDLGDLAKRVASILVQDEIQRKSKVQHVVADEADNAKRMLKLMLASHDFKDLKLERPISDETKDKVLLALVNAAAGALRLVWDGKATCDSIFELAKGEMYDLAKGADVYRIAVATAAKARETFIDEAGLKEKLEKHLSSSHLDEASKKVARGYVKGIIDARKQICGVLDKVGYDIGDGKTATIEKKLKEVRERMRAFRYDIEKKNGTAMAGMEKVRRWFDDINGVQDGRKDVQNGFKAEAEAIKILNKYLSLRPNEEFQTCLHAEATKKATNLTHTANNEIRYYFTGKERKIDTFSAKAHEIFDDMKSGESRTVKLTLGGKVAGEIGIADAEGSVQYARTVKVSKSGGEYVLTLVDGIEAEGKASFGVSPDSEEAGIGGGGTLGGAFGVKKSVSYRSVSDLIADLKGESQVVSATSFSTRLVLGYTWAGAKWLGNKLLGLSTALGFREHRTLEDHSKYQAMLVNMGVLTGLDTMLAANQRAIKTVETSAKQLSGSIGSFGNINVGGAYTPKIGGAGKFTYSTDRFVKSATYRSLVDALSNHSDDHLKKVVRDGRKDALEVADREYKEPRDLADIKDRLTAMENRMRDLEAKAEESKSKKNEHGFGIEWQAAFVEKWRSVAAEAVLLKRKAEAILAEDGSDEAKEQYEALEEVEKFVLPHLDRPQVEMDEQDFKDHFLEQLFTEDNGTVTHTNEETLNLNLLANLPDMAHQALHLPTEEHSSAMGILGGGAVDRFGHPLVETAINTTLPGDQTITYRKTVSRRVNRDDVRPWKNDSSMDIELSLSANLTTRAVMKLVARIAFGGESDKVDMDGEAPELIKQFKDDLVSNLVDAAISASEKLFFDLLGSNLPLPLSGKIGSDYDSSSYPTLKWHFENGRLVSIAEVESGVTKGSLSIGAEINGVKVGLKAGASLTEVAVGRKALVTPPLKTMLAKVETLVRAGKGVASVEKVLCEKKPKALYRLAKMFNGVGAAEPDPKDPRLAKDREDAQAMLKGALKLLDKAKEEHGLLFGDRVDVLKASLVGASNRLRDADLRNEEKRGEVLHDVSQVLVDLSKAYTLAKEAGFKAGDEAA